MIDRILMDYSVYIDERFGITNDRIKIQMDEVTYAQFEAELGALHEEIEGDTISTIFGMEIIKNENCATSLVYLTCDEIVLGIIKMY